MKAEFFESISNEVEGKFRRVSHLLKKSNQKSGEFHEQILRSTLSNFLSNRFTVRTGYMWLNDNTQSKQIDILIIDENYPFAYLFKDEDFVIVRPEAVVAVIEVKTILNGQQFIQAFENIHSAKQVKMKALGHYGNILGCIFGYETSSNLNNKSLEKLFTKPQIARYFDIESALWPDTIFYFKKSTYLMKGSPGSLKRNTDREYYYRLFKGKGNDNKAWQLSFLIASIIASCEMTVNTSMSKIQRIKSTDLLDFDGAQQGVDGFRPKEGHRIVEFA